MSVSDSKIPLRLKARDWDFFTPILLGDVGSDVISCRLERVPQLIDDLAGDPDCDAAELSLSRYNLRVAEGRADGIVAVPFFIMRGFRTRCILTSISSPLEKISDLKGKTIGLSGWQDSGNTWTRELMRREGIEAEDCRWILSRCTASDKIDPERGAAFADNKTIFHDPNETPLTELLSCGKIDAFFQAFMPRGYFTGELGLRPVVRDFKSQELDWYAKTGYVPGIHILAFKEAYVKEHPEAVQALASLIADSRTLWREKRRRYAETTPWIAADLLDEGMKLAADYDAFGLAANRAMTNDFCREAFEQRLTPRLTTADELFAKFAALG